MVLRVDVVDAALRAAYGEEPRRRADRRCSPPSGRQLDDALADRARRRTAPGAALRALRGRRRARSRPPRRRRRSRSAPTCSPAASSRRWWSPTPSCASCRARSGTPTARSRSRSRSARGRARVPALHAAGRATAAGRCPRSCSRAITSGCASGASSAAASAPTPTRLAGVQRRVVYYLTPAGPRTGRPLLYAYPPRRPPMSTIIESIEQRQLQQVPRFDAGDRVRVHFQVIEGNAPPHPGLRGHRHRPPGQRRARDLHRPQAVVRRRRRANLPGPLAEDRAARGRRPWRRPPRKALLPARPRRQAGPGRRASLGDRGRPRHRPRRGAGGGRLRGREPGGGRAGGRPPRMTQRTRTAPVSRLPTMTPRRARRGRVSRRSKTTPRPPRVSRRPRESPPRKPNPRAIRPRARIPRKTRADPEADNGPRRAARARPHRRARDRARARNSGLRGQALPDPLAFDGPDPRGGPAGAGQPPHLPARGRSRDR